MKKALSVAAAALILNLSVPAAAQSSTFNLGRGLDIEYSILKSLARSYVDTIDYTKMITKGVEAMLETLDPYTVYIPEEATDNFAMMTTGNYGGCGALIRKRTDGPVVIFEPYANSPAVKCGLEPGDEIWEIDGKTVVGETSDKATDRMKGQPGTDVKFKVFKGRTRDTVEVVLRRERIHISSIEYAAMIRDSIGFVAISSFTDKMTDELRKTVQGLKAQGAKRLVIDLRDNGGGVMSEAVRMAGLFLPKGTLVVSSKGRDPKQNQEYRTTEEPIDTLIPILVMVNSSSASASEIFAGAMQDLDRGTIAGRRTYGKGLIQSVVPTPYNGNLKITTGKYYTPSGRCVQAIDYSHRNEDGSVGFVPDSLKKEFKTKNGRSVYDGGGITPDIEVKSAFYSRPTVALTYAGIPGDFSLEYYKTHPQIAPAADFRLTDAEYEQFVEFAAAKEFDARSGAEAVLDNLTQAAEQDGLYEQFKGEIEALKSKIKMDKRAMLRLKKEEILPILEADIVVKYYYPGSGTAVQLRVDKQLDGALDKWLNQ